MIVSKSPLLPIHILLYPLINSPVDENATHCDSERSPIGRPRPGAVSSILRASFYRPPPVRGLHVRGLSPLFCSSPQLPKISMTKPGHFGNTKRKIACTNSLFDALSQRIIIIIIAISWPLFRVILYCRQQLLLTCEFLKSSVGFVCLRTNEKWGK